jgi:hypothetical protein
MSNIIMAIKSSRMRRAVRIERFGAARVHNRISDGNSEEKRRFGRPSRRWEGNIIMGKGKVVPVLD